MNTTNTLSINVNPSKLSSKEATSFSQDRMNAVLRNNFNKSKATAVTNMHLAHKTQVINSFRNNNNGNTNNSTDQSFTRAASGSVPKVPQYNSNSNNSTTNSSSTPKSFLNTCNSLTFKTH